jgi:MoCo/4Fe-4S cofactor protein with predicted Tat translocation signal
MSSDLNPKLPNPLELDAVRAKLARENGKRFWQSIDQLSETTEYREFLENEFPHDPVKDAEKDPEGINRREVLKLAAASAALAGLSACTKLPTQKIVPYVKPPEEIIPGRPLFYATSMTLAGVASGLLVESHMGRPTKIEGNREHPGSLGGTDVFAQAATLGLYDPDRSKTVIHDGRITDWPAFQSAIGNARTGLLSTGSGLRLLTETVTSPSLAAQIQSILKQYPGSQWHQYEPCGRDNAREGARLAFGKPVNTVYKIDQADIIVSLDADFLTCGPGHVRYAREFSSRRVVDNPETKLNRLYVVESMTTSTGAVADHRKALRSSDVEAFARELAAAAGVGSAGSASAKSEIAAEWTKAVGKDLAAHRGTSLVLAGEEQPPAVHALAHAINAALGNVGKTVYYTEPIEANPVSGIDSLRQLVADMNANKVQLLFILGGNPIYDAPADLKFGDALGRVPMRVHSGLYFDETAEYSQWHVPAAHFLEGWGDARAFDGTASIIQPLIQPLYQGRSAHEVLAAISNDPEKTGHDIVRDYWSSQRSEKDKAYEAYWETSLHDGLLAGTTFPAISVTARTEVPATKNSSATADDLEIVFKPDPAVFDGRFANNGWLQELPKPNTKLTWDNAAMVSPQTAQRLGLVDRDYVKLQLGGREVKAGIMLVPGHANNSITLHLGYGRYKAGSVGSGPGFNANQIRTSGAPWIANGLRIEKTGEKYYFAVTQHQYAIDRDGHQTTSEEGEEAAHRELLRVATLDEYRKDPDFAINPEEKKTKGLTLYPGFKYDGYAWGMAIDLNKCVGCNACVVACQSENNIPVVGKEQVMRGRAMQWIRVDTYFRGDLDAPETYYEPVLCMHCEDAPCEVVCPVGATVHSPEGLNEMVYNRCVGTRYCSNNCPYKVRRFNFFLYSDYTTPSLYGMRNPNVTVRSRGVMEKCTYCVQRINAAKIQSEEQDRQVKDGEIVTACQGACPANAIEFGNINDKNSRVAKQKANSRNYSLLDDLNTRPRTTYLARVLNPNPEIRG